MTLGKITGYRREPFPFRDATEKNFEGALTDAALRTRKSAVNLEDATRACVRQLKTDGMTPEGVIITMRAYLRHVMYSQVMIDRYEDWHSALEGLCDRLANWCIDEYFHA